MTNIDTFQLEYTFADDRRAEIDREIALLLSTQAGTMPLARDFGIEIDFLDLPPDVVKSLYTAEVTKKIAKFIQGVRVKEVTWTATNDGAALRPKVVLTDD